MSWQVARARYRYTSNFDKRTTSRKHIQIVIRTMCPWQSRRPYVTWHGLPTFDMLVSRAVHDWIEQNTSVCLGFRFVPRSFRHARILHMTAQCSNVHQQWFTRHGLVVRSGSQQVPKIQYNINANMSRLPFLTLTRCLV